MTEGGGAAVRVVPPVEIDVGSADGLAAAIADAYAAGARSVQLDFAQVLFCDSSGLRVLVNAAKLARALGREFVIVNPTRRLLRLADIVGASDLLQLPPPDGLLA